MESVRDHISFLEDKIEQLGKKTGVIVNNLRALEVTMLTPLDKECAATLLDILDALTTVIFGWEPHNREICARRDYQKTLIQALRTRMHKKPTTHMRPAKLNSSFIHHKLAEIHQGIHSLITHAKKEVGSVKSILRVRLLKTMKKTASFEAVLLDHPQFTCWSEKQIREQFTRVTAKIAELDQQQ